MSSAYEKWISANLALFACYEKVSTEQYEALSKSDQDSLCKSEAVTVASFLNKDEVSFKNILASRIASFDEKHWAPQHMVTKLFKDLI